MALSDRSKNLISYLLLSALNSVIIFKYLWIWFIGHTWKAVNKILKYKWKYRTSKVQGLEGKKGGTLWKASGPASLFHKFQVLGLPGHLSPPQAPQPIQSKPLCGWLLAWCSFLQTLGRAPWIPTPLREGAEECAEHSERSDVRSLPLL